MASLPPMCRSIRFHHMHIMLPQSVLRDAKRHRRARGQDVEVHSRCARGCTLTLGPLTGWTVPVELMISAH